MRVRQRHRRNRKVAGVLGGKTSMVSYSAEQQQRLRWLQLHLSQRSGQKRSVLTSVSDARQQKRWWCLDRPYCTRYFSCGPRQPWQLAAATEREKRWELSQRESKMKRITRSGHHSLLIPANYSVHLLCFPGLSVPCWIFVRASFLRNPKPKNP